MAEENRTNQLLEVMVDELFLVRKDKQEQEDQESGRPSTWRSAGERDKLRQSLDARRNALNLAVGASRS